MDFLSSFSGQVDFLHMEQDQASSYTEGTKVKPIWYIGPLGLYKKSTSTLFRQEIHFFGVSRLVLDSSGSKTVRLVIFL